jgi:hypothetical protein
LQHAKAIGQGFDEAVLAHFERYALIHRCNQSFSGNVITPSAANPTSLNIGAGCESNQTSDTHMIWATQGSIQHLPSDYEEHSVVRFSESRVFESPLTAKPRHPTESCYDTKKQSPETQSALTRDRLNLKRGAPKSHCYLRFDGVVELPNSNYSQLL